MGSVSSKTIKDLDSGPIFWASQDFLASGSSGGGPIAMSRKFSPGPSTNQMPAATNRLRMIRRIFFLLRFFRVGICRFSIDKFVVVCKYAGDVEVDGWCEFEVG